MTEERPKSPRELLPKMSLDDRYRYTQDVLLYGRACMQTMTAGSVVYVPPEEWPDPIKPKRLRYEPPRACRPTSYTNCPIPYKFSPE